MKSKYTGRAALCASGLLGLALTAGPAPAEAHIHWGNRTAGATADAGLTQIMASGRQTGWLSVIVKVDGSLTPERQARMTALGADVTRSLPIIQSVAVRVPVRSLKALAALPFVQNLSTDAQVQKCDAFTTGSSLATALWQKPYSLTGQGVAVAVLDSGINGGAQDLQTPPAPMLAALGLTSSGNGSRVVEQVSFAVDANGHPLDPNDQCGHGTHVSGIIAGDGAASYGPQFTHTFYGVAPLANLVNVRVLDSQGAGSVSQVVAGIQWVLQHRNDVVGGKPINIRVINLSLGHPVGESYKTDPLCQAAEAAWRAGIVVVCAAGNEGRLDSVQDQTSNEGWGTAYGSIQSPGNDPFVITVGASKQAILPSGAVDTNRADDKIATYSSRGPTRLDLVCKPDLIAPGNLVISLFANNNCSLGAVTTNLIPLSYYQSGPVPPAGPGGSTATSNNYFRLSGSSMATPVVAGAAALLLQKYPTLTPDTIKARLMLSADKLASWCDASGNYDACTYGAGYLDIPAALSSTTVITGEYAISPSLSIDANGNAAVNDDHALWGATTVTNDHALWGKSALWGSGGVTDLHALWGKNALWSSNELASGQVLLGSTVWNDHALWGCSSDAVDLSSTALNGE